MKRQSRFRPGPSRKLILVALLAFVLPAPASAQLQPPQFSKHALLNGLEIFLLREPVARPQFVLMIKNGAAFDPIDKWGATLLMYRMMTTRTDRRTPEELRQDLATLGAEIQLRLDWDAAFLYGSAPKERLEDVLGVLAEMVVKPKWDEELFESLRAALIQEVTDEAQSPELRTQEVFLNSLFQQNPYAHGVKGEVETLNNLTLNDIKIQYRKLVMPNQAQLAFYFDGDDATLLRGMGRRWGPWVRDEPLPFTFRQADPPAGVQVLILDRPGEQSVLRMGALGPRRGERDFYALKVLEQYLTLSLPAWGAEIGRSNQIQASVQVRGLKMPGFVQFNVKAATDQAPLYLRRVRSALREIRDGRIDPARFKEAKELAFLELRNRLENPSARLFELLEANLYELGVSYLATYGLRLDRVSPDTLREVAATRLPESSFLVVVAGTAARLSAEMGEDGAVRVLN